MEKANQNRALRFKIDDLPNKCSQYYFSIA